MALKQNTPPVSYILRDHFSSKKFKVYCSNYKISFYPLKDKRNRYLVADLKKQTATINQSKPIHKELETFETSSNHNYFERSGEYTMREICDRI